MGRSFNSAGKIVIVKLNFQPFSKSLCASAVQLRTEEELFWDRRGTLLCLSCTHMQIKGPFSRPAGFYSIYENEQHNQSPLTTASSQRCCGYERSLTTTYYCVTS